MSCSIIRSKKGASWLGYVLATALFITLSIGTIMWFTSTAETATKGTVELAEGKAECRSVLISSSFDEGDCKYSGTLSIEISNKGMLNIAKLVIQEPTTSWENNKTLVVGMGVELTNPINLNKQSTPVYIVPVIKSAGKFFGCADKKLKLACKK